MRSRLPLLSPTVLLGLLSLAACEHATPPVAPPRFDVVQSAGGRIAFVSNRDGNNEIYVMNADGTGLTRLTNDPASDLYPAWSPDGTRLAFTSTRDGHNNIYVMNADGTGVTQLTTSTGSVGSQAPAWCGTKIAYMSDDYLGSFPDVYSMNDDGTGQTRLTTDNASFDEFPTWSPDCARIAFSIDPDGSGASISVMNADGTGVTGLVTGPGANKHPAWSPDGTRIAFISDRDTPGNSTEIYVTNADGTPPTRVTTNSAFHLYDFPAWSSDQAQIAFYAYAVPTPGIYVTNADGSGTRLFSDSAYSRPAWFGPGTGGNQPPVAAFTSSCSGLTCAFTSTSTDPDGSISASSWTFGDGGTSTAQNPSYTYAAGGTYTVTLTVTDNQGATNSASNRVTVTAPPPPAIHVGNLDGSTSNDGPTWSATVAITVQDSTQALVSGATVTGNWSDGSSVTCATDASGTCGVTLPGVLKRVGAVTFTVTGVVLAGRVYDSSANQDPDGDSNGTSITVTKP